MGRIAAVYSNDSVKFSAHKFCLVPKDGFRTKFTSKQVEEAQLVYDRSSDGQVTGGHNYNLRLSASQYTGCILKVIQVLGKARQLTIL